MSRSVRFRAAFGLSYYAKECSQTVSPSNQDRSTADPRFRRSSTACERRRLTLPFRTSRFGRSILRTWHRTWLSAAGPGGPPASQDRIKVRRHATDLARTRYCRVERINRMVAATLDLGERTPARTLAGTGGAPRRSRLACPATNRLYSASACEDRFAILPCQETNVLCANCD